MAGRPLAGVKRRADARGCALGEPLSNIAEAGGRISEIREGPLSVVRKAPRRPPIGGLGWVPAEVPGKGTNGIRRTAKYPPTVIASRPTSKTL